MLQVLGAIGLGLVWGWLAARLLYHTRWSVVISVLLGLVAQGLIVLRLSSARAALWFCGALVVGGLIGLIWIRTLEARRLAAGA
jgi:hypothetical protein